MLILKRKSAKKNLILIYISSQQMYVFATLLITIVFGTIEFGSGSDEKNSVASNLIRCSFAAIQNTPSLSITAHSDA